MISRTCLYIALAQGGDLRVGLTKDLRETAQKIAMRGKFPLRAIVYIEDVSTIREAAARYLEVRKLPQEELFRLVTTGNPAMRDLAEEFTPVAARLISSVFFATEFEDEDDEGGVLATLPTSPFGPIRTKPASFGQLPPPLWEREREYTEIFGA